MITAEQLIDQLVEAIEPPKGNVITLREYEPRFKIDANWIPGTGHMSHEALKRYGAAVANLRARHRRVDWRGVEKFDGHWRHLMRYSI
ncbi:hypothetical protein [Bradyrhizobium sp. Gha]|uniref:hypothetical protein n=1 Tax=Bradyrhizobium sp. Gha TaxID=1855318 RepID=UPI0008EC6441|nr:hypothetical protein [Bradyrhizobium sp. Gha]SFK04749.1 hypothetical protein SAMN05216525_14975 [Bradyrhizobium sp. Gha]